MGRRWLTGQLEPGIPDPWHSSRSVQAKHQRFMGKGEVRFDGYLTDPGPPPLHRFQEAKGSYAWMSNIPNRLEQELDFWYRDQFARQIGALEDLPNTRLEWNFAEQSVADAFRARLMQDLEARELMASGRVTINWVPMTKDG